MRLLRRYRMVLILVMINLAVALWDPEAGEKSVLISLTSIQEVCMTLPPIFILLGLLDVWVPRETMVKLLGNNSGLTGITVAFLLGSLAAGPLYAAFPIASVLMRKGSKFTNVLIFIGAWSTTKIPLLLFEASSMGWPFMLARFLVDIPGIVMIAYITDKAVTGEKKAAIYQKAGIFD